MGGRNEKLYNFEHLEHHKPVQLGVTYGYGLLHSRLRLGRPDRPKDHSKNINGP